MSQPVLSVEGLCKRFGTRTAVSSVSLQIQPGEVLGFLGPNGAGKTTTIRMLVGLIRPTAGTVKVDGIEVGRDTPRALARVGCIVESPDLYGFLTGRENLDHFARMLGPTALARVPHVAARVRLAARLDDRVETYSLGMRQRLGIAQALLCEPRLLLLDEPANGLDPAGIHELRGFVREFASEGMAVLVSSHVLSEIEQMCDSVVILHRGRTLASGKLGELLAQGNRSLEQLFLEATHGETVD